MARPRSRRPSSRGWVSTPASIARVRITITKGGNRASIGRQGDTADHTAARPHVRVQLHGSRQRWLRGPADERELGFTPIVYGLGAGYVLRQLLSVRSPSNIAMHRFGARIWLSRIGVTWGLVACATAFIPGLDVILYHAVLAGGFAEAGFILAWCSSLPMVPRGASRARALALFQTGQAIAVIIGAPAFQPGCSPRPAWAFPAGAG